MATSGHPQGILTNRARPFASTRLGGVRVHGRREGPRARPLEHVRLGRRRPPPARNALDFLRPRANSGPHGRRGRSLDGDARDEQRRPSLEAKPSLESSTSRGSGHIGEIAEFFELFRDLWEFPHTLEELQQLLSSEQRFPDHLTGPNGEAGTLLSRTAHEFKSPGGFIINRVDWHPNNDDVALTFRKTCRRAWPMLSA